MEAQLSNCARNGKSTRVGGDAKATYVLMCAENGEATSDMLRPTANLNRESGWLQLPVGRYTLIAVTLPLTCLFATKEVELRPSESSKSLRSEMREIHRDRPRYS